MMYFMQLPLPLTLHIVSLLHFYYDSCFPTERIYPNISLFHKSRARSLDGNLDM